MLRPTGATDGRGALRNPASRRPTGRCRRSRRPATVFAPFVRGRPGPDNGARAGRNVSPRRASCSTPEDSGTSQTPVVYAAYPRELPVLSGGQSIGGWKPAAGKPGAWMAEVPEVKEGRAYFHQLFVNGQRRQRARTPNAGFFQVEGQIDRQPGAFSGFAQAISARNGPARKRSSSG